MDLSKAKVCIPTSSGGHLTHMRMLMPALSKAADRFWVTFDKEDANTALADERVYHCFFPTNRNVKLTGRLVRRISDLFVVQWPEMQSVYPGSVDLGSIF